LPKKKRSAELKRGLRERASTDQDRLNSSTTWVETNTFCVGTRFLLSPLSQPRSLEPGYEHKLNRRAGSPHPVSLKVERILTDGWLPDYRGVRNASSEETLCTVSLTKLVRPVKPINFHFAAPGRRLRTSSGLLINKALRPALLMSSADPMDLHLERRPFVTGGAAPKQRSSQSYYRLLALSR